MRRLLTLSCALLLCSAISTSGVAAVPTISLTSPPPNAVISEALTPTILLQSSIVSVDAPIAHVVFYVCALKNGTCSVSDTTQFDVATTPYQVLWTPPRSALQPSGAIPYQAWATVVNTLGQGQSSAVVSFSLIQPPDPPSVTLVAPKREGGYVMPASPVLFAMAAPGNTSPPSTIMKVDFVDGDTVIGTVTTPNSVPAGYALVWQNAPPGMHLIAARVTDSLGYSKTTEAVTIYIIGPDPSPQVTLTTPATGQIFAPPNAVPLAATATSALGTIQRVEFVTADKVIGTVFTPPYTASWNNPPPGNFAIVATAYDDIGVAAASPAAYVQVLATARVPVVVMTSPAPWTAVSSSTPLPIAATALSPDGDIGRVDFFADTTLLGSSLFAPYQFTWASPTAGTQSLTAKAYDLQGKVGVSAAVGITVTSHSPPTVNLTAPVTNSTYTVPANVPLSANATATGASISRVEYLANGTLVATSTAAPFTSTWSGAGTGTYALTAKATDSLGASATSATVNIVFNSDQPPQVALTSPNDAQTFYAGQSVAIAATASDPDGTISKVEFLVDGVVIASAASAPFNTNWNGASVGMHTLVARATDNLGAQSTTAGVSIAVIANSPPSVALILPRDSQSFAAGASISLSATASDAEGTIARVDFLADGVLVGTAASAPYNAAWSNASAGTHTLVARGIDDRGANTTSTAVTIHVVSSSLTITTPVPDSTIPADFVLVTGTYQAPPNSGVTVNGVVARNDGQGHFFANNVPLVEGANTLTVTLTTQDGKALTQTQTVTRRGLAPFQVYAEPDADVAPATFTIRVTNRTANTIASVAFSGLADGQLDATGADQSMWGKIAYALPGVFSPVLVITDSSGNTYTQTVRLLAQDKALLDQTLKAIWGDFSNALASGDKWTAMGYFGIGAKAKYGPVLDVLAGHMSEMVSNWSPPRTGRVARDIAEYSIGRVISGVKRLYFVYFVSDSYGIWRLDSM
jgi:sulfur relay (sulfurtransferase) complex TusBCD TusD component (DsrE family)